MRNAHLVFAIVALLAGVTVGHYLPRRAESGVPRHIETAPIDRSSLRPATISDQGSLVELNSAWNKLTVSIDRATIDELKTMLSGLRSASGPIDELTAKLLIKRIAELNPKEGAQQALSLTDPLFKQESLQLVMRFWGRSHPQEGAEWIDKFNLSPAARNIYYMALLRGWAETDPKGAAAHVAAQESSADNWNEITLVGRSLGDADPDAAKNWLQQLAPWQRRLAVEAVSAGIAHKDPAAAARSALTMPKGELQSQVLEKAVAAYTLKDPAAAAQFIKGLPGFQRLEATNVALQSASKDVKLFEMTSQALNTQFGSSDVNGKILQNLYAVDPAAAAKWVNSIPSDAMTTGTIDAANFVFIGTDLLKTVQWLSTVSNAVVRDRAMAEIAYRTELREPTISQQALQSITDPKLLAATHQKMSSRVKKDD